MIQRGIALILLLLLAACSSSQSPESATDVPTQEAAEATAEATEITNYQFELDAEHTTPLNWGGTATFSYPSAWNLRDTSQNGLRGEITIFAPDNYSLSVSFNNDPANTTSTIENVLNILNQTASIDIVEPAFGRSVYTTATRGGHAFAAAVYVDGTSYALVELVNSGQRDLEPMKSTVYRLLMSVTIAAGE
jgi:hypothetical protein